MVNFMSQLDWAMDAQVASKTLFLGESVRGFPEEMSLYLVD